MAKKNGKKQQESSFDNLKPMMDERAKLKARRDEIDGRIKELDDHLRPALQDKGEIVYNGASFKVTTVPGRTTYDTKKMIADGMDLTPYEKVGAPSTRFVVKLVNEVE